MKINDDYDKEAEIRQDEEWSQKDEWYSENSDSLKEDFIKEHKNEFDEMLSQEAIIDEDRDIDYWKDAFCEDLEDEFNEYVNDAFEDEIAWEQTKRDLR